ncbi:MAG: hypothetical protein Q8K92_08065 [Leadbetterella sp.]|nr:hypothetical protein [Leadbetterella sp.]
MGVFSDEAVLRIKILGDGAQKDMKTLKLAAKDIKDELLLMENAGLKNSKAYKEMKTLLSDVNMAAKSSLATFDLQNASLNEMRAKKAALNAELNKLVVGSKEWMAKMGEIAPIADKINDTREKVKNFGKETEVATKNTGLLATAWGRIKDVAVGALAALSLDRLIEETMQFVTGGIKGAAQLDDAFGKIQKTTGMTKDEVAGMNEEIKKIDTRTAQNELLKIGEVGGQIGVAKDEMLGFVEATDMAVVALGDEFSGGAEEVTKQLAPMKTLFKETKDLEFGVAINKIGSAINELGAAGTATGPVVADFTRRVGQLGDLSPEISEVMGLGASFQELGLTAEISSGGIANIMLNAAKATGLFAEQLGMTTAEFEQLIRSNPNEVLLKLAESFKGMPIDVVVKRMDDLGIKSQEATKVMSLLKDQTDLVREKQELAGKAMAEGTSLTREFGIMNNTAAAQLEKNQKALENKRIELGQRLLPAYIQITKAGTAFTGFLAENGALILKAGAWVAAYVGLQKLQVMWTERQVLLEGLKAAAARVSMVLQGQQILINQAQTGSMNVLTAAETRAVAAANAFNNVMQRNAIILAATVALTGLKAMYDDYAEAVEVANSMSLDHIKKTDESIIAERKHSAELKMSIEHAQKLAYGTQERKAEIEKIMKVYPQYFKNMTAEQVTNWHLQQAYKGVNAELERKIELMAREKRVSAMGDRAASLKAELEGLGVYATTLTEYNKNAKESFSDGFKDIRGKLLEYEAIMAKMGGAQKDLANSNIKNFNAEAQSAAARYKLGKINLQQYRDEITSIQEKHKIFVANYAKEVAAHTAGTGVIVGNTEKKSKAAKKAAVDLEKINRDSAKLEVELWEKGFEKEMELAGLAYEEKKAKAKKEIVEEKELNTRLLILVEEYWQEKTAIEQKYTQLAASYQAIERTNTLEQIKEIPMQTIKLEEWKAGKFKTLNELVEKQKIEYWDAEKKRIEEQKRTLENQMQMGMQAIDRLMQKTEEYLDKIVNTSDDANKRMAASLGKEFLKPMQENLNAAKALMSGDIVGAAEGLVGFFKGMWDNTIGIKKTLKDIKESEFWAMFEDGFAEVNQYTEQIKETFGSLVKDVEAYDAAMSDKSGVEGVIEAQIKLGEQIRDNYETAVEKEEQYSDTVKRNIEDAYNLEVQRINDKYDILNQKAGEQFTAEGLAIQERTNRDLLAFLTNEDSKNTILSDYNAQRSFIMEAYASQIKPLNAEMSQVEIDGIMAATKARDEQLAKVEGQLSQQLQSVINSEGQRLAVVSETDKILEAGKEALNQLSIKYDAEELERNTAKNLELTAAEAKKNTDLETEAKRHNDELVRLGQDKDAALMNSFNALKEAMKTGYSEILAAANAAYQQGIITADQYAAAVQRVITLKQMLGDGGSLSERLTDRFRSLNIPGFALGTSYVDPDDYYPDGTDTVPAMLNKGERVLTAMQNKQLGNVSNEELVRMVAGFGSPSFSQAPSYVVNAGLVNSLNSSGVPTMGSRTVSGGSWVSSPQGVIGGFGSAQPVRATGGNYRGEPQNNAAVQNDGVAGALARNNELMHALVNLIANQTNEELKRIADKPPLTLHDVNKAKAVERGASLVSDL